MKQKKNQKANYFDTDDALCFALYSAHRLMNQAYRPFLAKVNLTYPQFLVMVNLWNQDDQSLKNIGDKLLLDSGTLTPLVKRLIEMQLVEKVRSEDDERTLVISLTKKGKLLKRKCSEIPEGMFCKLKLEITEFVDLRERIKTLTANLQQSL